MEITDIYRLTGFRFSWHETRFSLRICSVCSVCDYAHIAHIQRKCNAFSIISDSLRMRQFHKNAVKVMQLFETINFYVHVVAFTIHIAVAGRCCLWTFNHLLGIISSSIVHEVCSYAFSVRLYWAETSMRAHECFICNRKQQEKRESCVGITLQQKSINCHTMHNART